MCRHCVFSNVILKLQERDVAAIRVHRNAIVGSTPDLHIGEQHGRFVELLRFNMPIQSDKAIKAPNVHSRRYSQCTKYACFDALTQAFCDEWAAFRNECPASEENGHADPAKPAHASPIEREGQDDTFSHTFAQLGALFLMQQNCQMFQRLCDGENTKAMFHMILEILHKQNPESFRDGTVERAQMERIVNDCQDKDCFLETMRDFSERLKEVTSRLSTRASPASAASPSPPASP